MTSDLVTRLRADLSLSEAYEAMREAANRLEDHDRLRRKAAAALRGRMCPDCGGAGEIVHGTSPDDEWSEPCSSCRDVDELIGRRCYT